MALSLLSVFLSSIAALKFWKSRDSICRDIISEAPRIWKSQLGETSRVSEWERRETWASVEPGSVIHYEPGL